MEDLKELTNALSNGTIPNPLQPLLIQDWGKVACWSTKAAISLKRVKIDEKLLWIGGPVGTHQRSFERYHPQPPAASP